MTPLEGKEGATINPNANQAPVEIGATTVRVTGHVYRQLATIQYQRKMAGESVSFSEIIGQLLDRAGAA